MDSEQESRTLESNCIAQGERRQAEIVDRYKKMYDRSSALAKIGVWEFDLRAGSLTWTDGVYDLFELPRGSAISRAATLALYDPESRLEMERLRASAIATGGSFALDIRVRTATGKDRWLRLTADVEQENGRSVRIFGTKQDITVQKEAQEREQALQAELIHLSRLSAMGAMASTLAHELNQPLTAISSYAAGTRRALENPGQRDQVESGLEAIEACTLRAGAIIRSLRAIAEGSPPRRRRLNPNALIRESGALAAAGAGDAVSLRYDLADDIMVLVDPVQIQQVLINLIKNAIEALQDSPVREILVSTCLVDGAPEIRVEDSGPGIPEFILGTLFERAASLKPDGLGIGLSISRTIVEAHNGRISAANRPGGGASFRVSLPPCPPEPSRAESVRFLT